LKYRRISRLEEIENNNAVILLADNKPEIKADLKSRTYSCIDVLASISSG